MNLWTQKTHLSDAPPAHSSHGLQADRKNTPDRRQFPSQGSSLLTAPVFTLFDSPLHKQPCSHWFLPSDTAFLKAGPHKKFASHYISWSSLPLPPPPTTPYVPPLFPAEQSLASEMWQLKWPPCLGPQLCLSRSQGLQLAHSALLRSTPANKGKARPHSTLNQLSLLMLWVFLGHRSLLLFGCKVFKQVLSPGWGHWVLHGTESAPILLQTIHF